MVRSSSHPNGSSPPDILFFCHLRWDFVVQRPQHLVSRWARDHRAWFWEEPEFDAAGPWLEVRRRGRVTVATPHLRADDGEPSATLRPLLDQFLREHRIEAPIGWYWTPMMRPFSDHVPFRAVVWDCMDELAGFAFAPSDLARHERDLLCAADVVFTGGHELWRAKRALHPNVHAFPSSVDVAHFGAARRPGLADPDDQRDLPRPRVGWFGVIDERTDLDLVAAVAARRRDWSFVMLGPVVKVDPATLPRAANIHWLGMKAYDDLPAYVAYWDVAMLPFARNAATRFISPTKTPEYLAAGRPVVSTSIADVVRPYGEQDLVRIADDPDAFEAAIADALADGGDVDRRARADALLATMSWDDTVARMRALVDRCTDPALAATP